MIYRATGNLESAKGIGLIALVSAFLLAWPALELCGFSRRTARLGAALAAANPVTLTQLLSLQVDGLVASSIVIVLSLAVLYLKLGDRRWAAGLVLMAVFLANLKFPALLYALLIALALIGFVAWRQRSQLRPVLLLFLVAGVATVVEGANPYLTNWARHGHPLYPARGPGAPPVVVHFDTVFAAQSRVAQFTRPVASASGDPDAQPPRLKSPFSVTST